MSGLDVAEFLASSQSIKSTHLRVVMLGSIDVHRSIAACPHVHGFTTKPIRRLPLVKMIIEQLKIKRGLSLGGSKHRAAIDSSSTSDGTGTTMEATSTSDIGSYCQPHHRPNPLSILLVEDNLINQKVIVSLLTQWKCRVTTALNGLSGFEERTCHRGKKAFDLVLMDLHMPLCDGFQCTKMIREWEEKNNVSRVKICAISADAQSDTVEQCLSPSGGFDKFISKPLRQNALKGIIGKLCGEDRLAENDAVPSSLFAPSNRQQEGASHVLVVDDNATTRLLMRTFLAGMGCHVSEAPSGEIAVEMATASAALPDNPHPIELVFCDILMFPGMDGMETSKQLKEIPGLSGLPIIGMTADEVYSADLAEAKASGMSSLITKPLSRAQLASFVADHTGVIAMHKSEEESSIDHDLVFDEAHALENCGNDRALLHTVLADISKDLEKRKEELRVAVQRKDSSRAAEIAHNIKGMSRVCGLNRLAEAARVCQEFATASDYIEVRRTHQIVMDEIVHAVTVCKSVHGRKSEKKSPPHVLVVDDTSTNRLVLRTMLGGMGCMVSDASSGESATEIVRTSMAFEDNPGPIRLVICDIRMPPGIDGLETARRMKMIPGMANVPIIGTTADEVSHGELQEAQSAGMAYLISKPVKKDQLGRILEEHVTKDE